jgi:hypothetical protein
MRTDIRIIHFAPVFLFSFIMKQTKINFNNYSKLKKRYGKNSEEVCKKSSKESA